MDDLNIFKIRYEWYEGDFGETLLAKDTTKEQFEKDLVEARDFAESVKGKELETGSFLGKGYSIECLPQFYAQIIWFLVKKKGYSECQYDEDEEYYVDDDSQKKIGVQKRVKKIVWEDIGDKEKREESLEDSKEIK